MQSKRGADLTAPECILDAVVALVHDVVEGGKTQLQEQERLSRSIVNTDELDHILVALDSECAREHEFRRARIHGCRRQRRRTVRLMNNQSRWSVVV